MSSLALFFFVDLSFATNALTLQTNHANEQSHHFRMSQSDHLEYIRRSKGRFRNKTLVVGIVVREPFVIFNQPRDWHRLSAHEQRLAKQDLANYDGVAIELVKRLKSIFNFNTRLTSPADNQFGIYSSENKSWNGLMGQLVRAEIDVGVTALSLTIPRGKVETQH
jgi:hypothetical protein